MNIDFGAALERLGDGVAIRTAREVTPPAEYLFNTLLPERNTEGYVAEHGSMTIRSTMAGLVGMDSPYPPSGTSEAQDFIEKLAKVANEVVLNEKTLRHLQERMIQLQLAGNSTVEALAQEALNFLNKAILQPHYDTAEWLRGQALQYGKIDWKSGQTRLQVDYGFEKGHVFAKRAGNSGYGGSDSTFWADVRKARSLLRYNVRAMIARPETIDMIVNNPANNVSIIAQQGFNFTIARLVDRNGLNVRSEDSRDTISLVQYQAEGEVWNPATDSSQIVPMMEQGKVLVVGNNSRTGYRVGEGSTPDPEADRALGYTHIGPTVEGGGSTGRWADLFTPQRKRYQLIGQGVTNLLPVIEAPDKVVVLNTDMVD